MGSETKHQSGNAIEQFVLLAKSAKGAAAAELIKQALDAPGVYVFRELMEMPHVKELNDNPSFINVMQLLNVFAYGTYKDYLGRQQELLPLTPNQKKKLQHLTIVSLSERGKCIPYDTLRTELDIENTRELEDLIIEAIYAEIIKGKLDQHEKELVVDTAIGRDIRPENVETIVSTLSSWCNSCDIVLSSIANQVNRANAYKTSSIQKRDQQEQEIANLRKVVKAHVQMDQDEIVTESREAKAFEKTPRKPTRAALRNSGKHFNK